VRDPEEIAPDDIRPVDGDKLADGSLYALVKTSRGVVAVLRPHALLSRGQLRSLPGLVERAEAR
jgi:hypothetical protein